LIRPETGDMFDVRLAESLAPVGMPGPLPGTGLGSGGWRMSPPGPTPSEAFAGVAGTGSPCCAAGALMPAGAAGAVKELSGDRPLGCAKCALPEPASVVGAGPSSDLPVGVDDELPTGA
jgi:hypothetical protein